VQPNPSSAPNRPTTAPLLSDYLSKLETHRKGRRCVHIQCSRLKSTHRREHNLSTASAGLSSLVQDGKGQLFHLSNSDLVFFHGSDPAHEPCVESELKKIHALFVDDPLVANSGPGKNDLFLHYNVEKEHRKLIQAIRDIQTGDQQTPFAGRGRDARTDGIWRQRKAVTFTPKLLHQLETALAQADLASFLRQSPIFDASSDKPASKLFSEWLVSVFDLAAATIPNCDLTADPWLFKHFTELLDKRVLAILEQPENMARKGTVSVNLNVATLLSDAFFAFDQHLFTGRHEETIIEIRAADIFHDLATFHMAARFVRSKGYRLCLDGVTQWTMDLIDREDLGFDYIKMECDQLLLIDAEGKQSWLKAAVDRAGRDRFILNFVETPEALALGRSAGVRYFQGRNVAKLLNSAR